jgi:hypothetical protein
LSEYASLLLSALLAYQSLQVASHKNLSAALFVLDLGTQLRKVELHSYGIITISDHKILYTDASQNQGAP